VFKPVIHGIRQGYGWVRNRDLIVLLSTLALVLGVWGFIELADEVREGETQRVDEWVVRSLRNAADPSDPVGPEWVEEAMRDFTGLGGTAVLTLATLFVSGFLLIRRFYHALGFLFAAVVGGVILDLTLKSLFSRPRPALVPHLSYVLTTSFPSGHSMLSAVVYLTLGALLARLVESLRLKMYILGVALFMSFLVGASRVYLGVHYPTDVLAGWTVGLCWAILCWLVTRHLQRRGAVERAGTATSGNHDREGQG
jgi:undecaprenyl-diphosphatase